MDLSGRFLELSVLGMRCHSCENKIKTELNQLPYVSNVQASKPKNLVSVVLSEPSAHTNEIVKLIEKLGFVVDIKDEKPEIIEKMDSKCIASSSNDDLETLHLLPKTDENDCIAIDFEISGMHCSSCVSTIESKILSISGVKSATVGLLLGTCRVYCDSARVQSDQIISAIEEAGDFKARFALISHNDYAFAKFVICQCEETVIADLKKFLETKNGILEITSTNSTPSNGKKSLSKIFSADILVKYDTREIGRRDIYETIVSIHPNARIVDSKVNQIGDQSLVNEKRKRFILSLLFGLPSFALMIFQMTYEMKHHKDAPQLKIISGLSWSNLILFLLSVIMQYLCSKPFYYSAYISFKTLHLNMDSLIASASIISFLYSCIYVLVAVILAQEHSPHVFFETPSMLLMFMCLGRWLEELSKTQTSAALTSLLSLQPSEATLIILPSSSAGFSKNRFLEESNYSQKKIGLSLVQKLDLLLILPGESIPVDGRIVWGNSCIDECILTGESIPPARKVGDPVFAGTSNLTSSIVIKATATVEDSTISQIAHLVQQAQNNKARVEQLVDTVAGYFVPVIFALSLFTLIIWLVLFQKFPDLESRFGNKWKFSFQTSITVLCVACPCALGLATPTAMLVATGRAALNGILIKGGAVIEKLSKVSLVAFDKTGTLTSGKITVKQIEIPENSKLSVDSKVLWKLFYLMEIQSNHPIAYAFTNFVKKLEALDDQNQKVLLKDVEEHPGQGVSCIIKDPMNIIHQLCSSDCDNMSKNPSQLKPLELYIGSEKFISESSSVLKSKINSIKESCDFNKHDSILYLAVNDQIFACLSLTDQVRKEAKKTIEILQNSLNVSCIMITGDSQQAAMVVADQLGLKTVFAGVLPKEKASIVEKYKRDGNQFVAMIGDGVNDSIAQACSSVGVALSSGVTMSMDMCDVVLVHNDLLDMANSIDLAKKTMHRVRLNLIFSFLYNLLAVPISAGCLAPLNVQIQPWMAVIAMALSSISVVCSSLSLNRYTKRFSLTS